MHLNTSERGYPMVLQKNDKYFIAVLLTLSVLFPMLAFASVESSLVSVQEKLTRVILPTLSVIGIAFAGFSFLSGNENARRHIMYAVIGSTIGFGAQSIAEFISSMVH